MKLRAKSIYFLQDKGKHLKKIVLLFDRNNWRKPQLSVNNSSGSDRVVEEDKNYLRLLAFFDNFLHAFVTLCVLYNRKSMDGKFLGGRGGGGAYVKFPPWWGYRYFLELHNHT